MKKLRFEVSLPVLFLKEGKYFVAYTPALDLATSGESFDQVRSRFAEVVQIFFEELLEKGTLEEVLSNLGWQKIQKEWVPPVLVSQQWESFKIPVSA